MRQTNLKNQVLFFSTLILFLVCIFAFSFSSFNDFFNKTPVVSKATPSSQVNKDGGPEDVSSVHTKEVKGDVASVDTKKSFSLIVLPDTQVYAKKYSEILCSQTEWIVKNKTTLNIQATIQLGDIVDSGGKALHEWENASKCLKKLSATGIWTILAGNHDTDIKNSVESGLKTFERYFGKAFFEKENWYKDSFRGNQNSFVSFESMGMKVGLISLSIEPDDEVLRWAEKIVETHKDLFFVVSTHKYLLDETESLDVGLDFSKNGNDGQSIWKELVQNNCNIKLVLNGHFHMGDGEGRLVSKNSCSQDVMQVVQDYQSREKGGNGRLRIYTFTPSEKKVEVKTYSPYTKSFEVDTDSQFEFGIENTGN